MRVTDSPSLYLGNPHTLRWCANLLPDFLRSLAELIGNWSSWLFWLTPRLSLWLLRTSNNYGILDLVCWVCWFVGTNQQPSENWNSEEKQNVGVKKSIKIQTHGWCSHLVLPFYFISFCSYWRGQRKKNKTWNQIRQ